ncbi:hypothetical protein CASFOL_012958 [Castilleja foliolosa]|uniref:Polygalacturonase n=1 Tax=Castilleja foliolosa TaxID=1961234 RepID=A0ABD3DIP9_9LAMI
MIQFLIFTFFFFNYSFAANHTYNVKKLGAKSNGKSDCTEVFLDAWAAACATPNPVTIYVPTGRYLLSNAVFNGKSCKNKAITIRIKGTLVAPSDYNVIADAGAWLKFNGVTGVNILGGTLDGQGVSLWDCKISGMSCPQGATNIGSLGKSLHEEGVRNVTVKTSTFINTQNGVRIKTWSRQSNAFVRNVLFQDLDIINARNPIIIDQNYCPGHHDCPTEGASGVQISNITYQDVHGTSASKVAVKLDCSETNPCTGITLNRVMLTYNNKSAIASCDNAQGNDSDYDWPDCFI